MCTLGYCKNLNIVFKNRDKNVPTEELLVVKNDVLAVKTEGADYYSLGTNRHGSCFATTAVNTPQWTALASSGKTKEAADLLKTETAGLVTPSSVLSPHLGEVKKVDELLSILLDSGKKFRGYNVFLADKEKAVHVELYQDQSHVEWVKTDAYVVCNHFRYLKHGPSTEKDYRNSYERFYALGKLIGDFVSLEDVFRAMKSKDSDLTAPFWRTGAFATVSSSVIDLDSNALYYSSDPEGEYCRISGSIPAKGSEKVFIEMSRYIDLPTYHKIERGHPFYEEMIGEIGEQIDHIADGRKEDLKTLELGAGTGLCSLELVKRKALKLDCLELDEECCKILSSHPESRDYQVICGDAVLYCKPHYYDLVVSVFAHDHIHFDKRFAFAKNIYNNLKKGGRYIMGGEILPYYSTEMERKKALFIYHNNIIRLALGQERVQLAELENNALKSGLDMVGDFKRHEAMFENEMESAGFNMVHKKRMGPAEEDLGGVYVYIFQK